MRNRSRGKAPGIHSLNVAVHWTRVNERVVIHDGNSASGPLVYIGDVIYVIDRHVVVNIRDLNVCNAGVAYIDSLNISRTGAIPGNVNFSRAEREPSHACAHSHADAETTAADEGHQRR